MDTLLAPVVLNEAQAIIWEADDPLSAEYAEALSLLTLGIEAGFISYAGTVAEAFATEGPLRDPAKAYVYYYFSYAQEGGLVEYRNLGEDTLTHNGRAIFATRVWSQV